MLHRNVGNLIKEHREKLDLSQQKLADRLGVHSQFISNIERGLAPVPKEYAREFCDILCIGFSTAFRNAVLEDTWEKYKKGVAA